MTQKPDYRAFEDGIDLFVARTASKALKWFSSSARALFHAAICSVDRVARGFKILIRSVETYRAVFIYCSKKS